MAHKRIRVYVAGPIMLGNRVENIRRGIEAGEAVHKAGMSPFIPFLNESWEALFPKSHAEWMAIDYSWLILCDAVLRLPGASKGADLEEAFAQEHRIPIFYNLDALLVWASDV